MRVDRYALVGIKQEIKFLPLQTIHIVLFVRLDIKSNSIGERVSLSTDGICAAHHSCPPGFYLILHQSWVPASARTQALLAV